MPFADVIGHRHLVDLLRQAVARKRVPQSLLFAGPEGVGKRAVAVALAQAVNCPSAREGDACGMCQVCRRIAAGTHSDVALLDAGGEASIKIRALRDRVLDAVGYRPFEGARRVFIVDPADEMTVEAQDALLKTLEEPPASALLVLVTAYPDTLMPTVQSRCRRLRFGPLAEADVARVLEGRGVPGARARAMAAVSGGTVARALASEDDAAGGDREAALGVLRAARGVTLAPRLKAAAALAQHGSKRRDRQALDARLIALASLTRDLAALASGARVPLANVDLTSPLQDLAGAFGPDRAGAAYDAIVQARQALDRNASPKIVADWLAVRV